MGRAGSRLMFRSWKFIPFASRTIFITSHLRQPDWVKRIILRGIGSVLSVHVFDLGGDLRGFLEHGRDRAVFLFGQADGVFNRLARHFTTDAVAQLDFRVDGGRADRALRLSADLEAGERLALLLENRNDVVTSASAQTDKDEFHGTVPYRFVAIDDDRVAAVGDAVEALLFDPRCLRFRHS